MAYFGNDSTGTSQTTLSPFTNANVDAYIPYFIDGTGLYRVDSLELRYKYGTGYVRCAIYRASDNILVMQGSAKIAVTGNVEAWKVHTSFTDKDGVLITSPQLVGGTHYRLASTAIGDEIIVSMNLVTSGWNQYRSTEYTDGFPETLSLPTNSSSKICIRCGVTAAGSYASAIAEDYMWE